MQKVFQWGGKQQEVFDALRQKISSAFIIALLYLKKSFEFQVDVCNYATGVVFMQCGKPISFHSETFNGKVFKLQRRRHFHWMAFLLLFHSIKRYKKGIHDKFVDVLSRPIVCITYFVKHLFVLHESYVEKNTYFQDVHSSLSQRNQVEEFVYHFHHNVLYHLGKKDVANDNNIHKSKEFIERLQMVHQTVQ